MNKLIIFDLDGTLIHSLPDIMYNVNTTLTHFGFPNRSEEEIRKFIGYGAWELIRSSFGNGVTDELVKEGLDYYNSIYNNDGGTQTVVFDGILDLLNSLKASGIKLAIVTNKPSSTTMSVYNKYLSSIEFDDIIGVNETVKRKPDPTSTLNLLENYDVSKENCYFVGDGETDVMTAINAGVKGVSVLWGYRDKLQLKQAGGTTFIEKPCKLLEIIK